MGDDRPCTMEGICTIDNKMFDEMVLELKDVRYVPLLKEILSPLVPWMHWVLKCLLEMVLST